MWLLLRLLIFAAMLGRRRLRALFPPTPTGAIDGQPYVVSFQRRGRRRLFTSSEIVSFTLAIDLPVPVVFRFTVEGTLDRFFTQLGLADEFQTGDAEFDRRIYIACDHPALLLRLREDAGLRRLVQQAMSQGYTAIAGDGTTLRLARPANFPPSDQDIRLLADLRTALLATRKAAWLTVDPFTTRVLVIEGIIWSIAGYALGALVDPLLEDFGHVHPDQVVSLGLLTAAGLFAALVTATFLLLRGSSQGHRVIIESALVLALSLPFAGPLLISDLNRHLDGGPTTPVHRIITSVEERITKRTGKSRLWGRTRTTYVIHTTGTDDFPAEISPPKGSCPRAAEGRILIARLHSGALGLRWYDGLEIR